MKSALDQWRERKAKAKATLESGGGFPNTIVGSVQDNGDLELHSGDRLRHDQYGDGVVDRVTGQGTKRVAHVVFDDGRERKLLIKLAPIKKLSER